MRFWGIFHILGWVILFVGLTMIPSLIFAWYDNEPDRMAWVYCVVSLILFGFFLKSYCSLSQELSYREGFCAVTFSWLGMAAVGAIPYSFSGVFPDIISPFFESTSGFTTTGATAIVDIEVLPRSILLWRSLTHWLGGMGVVVLSVCILPLLGVGGMQLFKAEAPGPSTDKLTPRIASTAKILWRLYLFLTALEVLLLYWCGMTLFDSFCHTFSTLATGGFSTKNTSIIAYDNPLIEMVIIIFMLFAGINFALHYRFLRGNIKTYFQNSEFKFYVLILLMAFAVVTWNIYGSHYDSLQESARFAAFQVVSISTTTGFITADFNLWPSLSQALLVALMMMGASAGSTGGGFKVIRVIILIKYGLREVRRLVYPKALFQVKLKGNPVPRETLQGVLGLFVVSVFVMIGATFVMSLFGMNILTAFTSVIACLWNIGPGLAQVGAIENYSAVPALGKLFLSLCMIMGRLEIFTVIVLFSPDFWRK
jgi:trk system potassium uptake protein TrkH